MKTIWNCEKDEVKTAIVVTFRDGGQEVHMEPTRDNPEIILYADDPRGVSSVKAMSIERFRKLLNAEKEK